MTVMAVIATVDLGGDGGCEQVLAGIVTQVVTGSVTGALTLVVPEVATLVVTVVVTTMVTNSGGDSRVVVSVGHLRP